MMQPLHALLVYPPTGTTSPTVMQLLDIAARHELDVHVLASPEEAASYLQSHSADVVILSQKDFGTEIASASETIRKAAPEIAILLVADAKDNRPIYSALMQGAEEELAEKSLGGEELVSRLNLAARKQLVRTELETAKMAVSIANRAKRHFIANLTHEIRTPLQGMLTACESLCDTLLDKQQQAHLSVISFSASSLLGLVNSVLDSANSEEELAQVELAKHSDLQHSSPHKQKVAVLIVDDNIVNLKAAAHLLSRRGYKVHQAKNGKAALETISGQKIDIVFMDCIMPVMNGMEATRLLREREKREGLSHLPVIATTAQTSLADISACLESGMDDYIAKPFDACKLEKAIKKHLGRKEIKS